MLYDELVAGALFIKNFRPSCPFDEISQMTSAVIKNLEVFVCTILMAASLAQHRRCH